MLSSEGERRRGEDERERSNRSVTPSEVLDRASRLDIPRSMEVVDDDDRQHVEDEDESGLGGEPQAEDERERRSQLEVNGRREEGEKVIRTNQVA